MSLIEAAGSVAAAADGVAERALAEPWLTATYHDPGYVPQAHHRLISAEMRHWADTPNSRLIITLPPQVGKSWTAVVWTTFWLLARDPTRRVIVTSCTADLAEYHGSDIRTRIEEYGAAHGLYLKRGSKRRNFFQTTKGGYVRCVGVGGMTTGFPATELIMDDLFPGWNEAMSPTYRQKTWMWASSVARTRLQRNGRIAHVGTRWNEDDVAGRFEQQQPGRWRVLRLPAIAVSEDDALGRRPGDPLPKPGYDETDREGLLEEWGLAKQDQPVVVWESLYQGDPVPPGGALIDTDTLQAREHLQPTARVLLRAVSIDPSVGDHSVMSGDHGGRQNTFGIVAGWLGDDDRVYLTNDATRILTPEQGCEKTLEVAYDTGAAIIYVEGNQGGSLWMSMLVSAWERLLDRGRVSGHMPRVDIHNAKEKKEVRAHLVAGFMFSDRVRFAAKMPEMWREWTGWRPGNDSPGRIDASGHLALKLLPDRAINHAPAASPAMSPMTQLGGGYAGYG